MKSRFHVLKEATSHDKGENIFFKCSILSATMKLHHITGELHCMHLTVVCRDESIEKYFQDYIINLKRHYFGVTSKNIRMLTSCITLQSFSSAFYFSNNHIVRNFRKKNVRCHMAQSFLKTLSPQLLPKRWSLFH